MADEAALGRIEPCPRPTVTASSNDGGLPKTRSLNPVPLPLGASTATPHLRWQAGSMSPPRTGP